MEVKKDVFSAIEAAAESNRAITKGEVAAIKAEMEKDGIDANEQAILEAIDRGSAFTMTSGSKSKSISPDSVSYPFVGNVDAEAKAIIRKHTDVGYVYDDLLEEDLGKALAKKIKAQLNAAPVALAALKKVNDSEVVLALIEHLSDQDLKNLSQNSDGLALLRYAYKDLMSWSTSAAQGKAMQRIVGAASSSHGHLATAQFSVDPRVAASLKANKAKLQFMHQGSKLRAPNYDTYEVTVKFANDHDARKLFEKFARNPNEVGDGYFDAMNEFSLRGGGGTALPKVGDIYDIDIAGPDDGSIIVLDASLSDTQGHLVVSTIKTPKYGSHPENGIREFGFRKNTDGSYTFYTKGASRGENSIIQTAGSIPQAESWKGLMDGFKDHAVNMGATVVKGRSHKTTSTPF